MMIDYVYTAAKAWQAEDNPTGDNDDDLDCRPPEDRSTWM